MMVSVPHIFSDHHVHPRIEILILGTFNPKTRDNDADFFYSRKKVRRPNSLWRLLPISLGYESMMGTTREDKGQWLLENRIDFMDLISEVQVETGQEANYYDTYLDDKVSKWNDVIGTLKDLPHLKAIYLTRKTVNSTIKNMRVRIREIETYCQENHIAFTYVKTPARGYSAKKQQEWNKAFNSNR